MREFLARLRDLFRRDALDRELQEELRFHEQMLQRDATSDVDAHRSARRKLGNVTRVREESRERWSFAFVDALQQDVRYALRGLRRSPGFTAAVLLTLGLGIGANAAMFNVIDQLMFRPFPFLREASQVHRVYLRVPGAQRLLTVEQYPYTRFTDLRKWTTSFSQYAAFHPATVAVGTGDNARERQIVAVSSGFFGFFDARPERGRFFVPADDSIPVGAPVAVISFAYWQRELGSREVIGEKLLVQNIDCTIVGITPKGFVGVSEGEVPDVYIPITSFGGHEPGGSSVDYWLNYRWDWTEMMVRTKAGVTAAQANADLTEAYIKSRDAQRALSPAMPRKDAVRPVAVTGALKTAAGPYPGLEARTLVWVTGVAGGVLLIACANVGNLFFARALKRRREIALRLALGVTRTRLATQTLTESLVFALLAAVVGVAFAQWGGVVLRRLVLPSSDSVGAIADWRTLLVAMSAALIAGVLTSFGPMMLASRESLSNTLKGGARSGSYRKSRFRDVLLVSQGALSVVLLVGAGLFVQSLMRVQEMRLGYDVDPVLTAQWSRRGMAMSTDERVALRRRVLDRTRTIPGVEKAAWASNIPIQGTSIGPLFVPGIDSVAKLGRFTYQAATPEYFDAIGTRIVRGRAFNDADRAGTPKVVVVSESMARVLWPNANALGQCIRVRADTMPCSEVVGVAEDAVHDPSSDQPLRYYIAGEQYPDELGSLLVLRVSGNAKGKIERIRATLQKEMPDEQYLTFRPLSEMVNVQRHS